MKITPEYISHLINFYSNTIEPGWSYNPAGTDMRNLQIKGAARVYNLLEENKLALLADEVGMGKTIQALSVCVALWNQKPDARVLVLVPREEIVKNWEREYRTFIRHHYRINDNVVKSIAGNEPVKQMVNCSNLYSLVHEVQQGWGQLFIGKISSFSSLMAKKNVIEWLEDLGISNNNKLEELLETLKEAKVAGKKVKHSIEELTHNINHIIIKKLKKEITKYSNSEKPYFDLLIIDEAHYFRKKDGHSLKVNSAAEFFGDPKNHPYTPIADKVLLLTATPNHSSSNDIGNIVSYFSNKFEDTSYKSILDKICVRRLRRLSQHGYNKYNYREEIPACSNFKENPLSEMFFGLYQHELAKEINKNKAEKLGGKGISRMMKYLEGVEFIPQEKPQAEDENIEDDSKATSTDYRSGSDAQLLLNISKKFKEIFGEEPKHPKYDKLVEDLTIKHTDDKALVFVRRIPSVREIAKRIVEYYDRRMWQSIKHTGLEKLPYEKLDRKNFIKLIAIADSGVNDYNENESNEDTKNIPSSKVLNLFKVIKNRGAVESTHASNFRLRFTRSKPNIFSMFFCPGEDYFNSPYEGLMSYRFESGNEQLENYFNSSLIHRAEKIQEHAIAKDILSILLPKNKIPQSGEVRDFKISTILTIFWEEFLYDPDIAEEYSDKVKATYLSFNHYEKESFSNFIEKGVLLASEGLVWFYEIFRMLQNEEEEKPLILYQKFTERIKSELKNKRVYTQIQESILHFRPIYTKVFSINGEKALLEESWDSFNNAQPIYPYNADNSNQKVLRCFNTPFFPDILVATSVLQEGVNLQYFCDTIYHYGMAWTPGDNEQRIGRIDRMFGKIERSLEKDKNSKLCIYYPYLKDTIDEEHLGRFIKRKYKEETLIDHGKAFQETADFAIEENDNDSWKQFLRKPDENNFSDPFPVEQQHFVNIPQAIIKEKNVSLSKFFYSTINAIQLLSNYNPEIYFIDQNDNQKLLVDPTLDSERKQPVVIELLFDHIGSGFYGHSVFCLRMRTPLASFYKLRELKNSFNQNRSIQDLYQPGIKLCLDASQSGGSTWGLYMSTELPLFLTNLNENPLSVEEIQKAFMSLIKCADITEKLIFNKDLYKEELNLPIIKPKPAIEFKFRNSKKQSFDHGWTQAGDYNELNKNVDTSNIADIEKQALINNHTQLYIKTFCKKGEWFYQVAHLAEDAHQVELALLEKHLQVFLNGLGW